MPRGNWQKGVADLGGFGKQGYCRLCSFKDGDTQIAFDDRVRQGWTPKQLNGWLQGRGIDPINRITIYNHREHVKHPQDRMVTAVQKAEQRALATKPKSSPDDFLEAVVSVAAQRVSLTPDEVSIDHGLRAAAELKRAKDSNKGGIAVLIGLLTGKAPPTVVEGHAVEVDPQ